MVRSRYSVGLYFSSQLGSAGVGIARPRRTAQARVWGGAVECRQVHGQAAWPAKPGMGVPSCIITCRRSPPWTCSSCRPLASTV